ncbi:ATP-binding protein [Streptomyces sp. NPDC026665]|uniref:ATP-binding protein n=1 Tax=Streptomyces sp. NPDC026665 TaxID=3154798 RepID=UPI0033E6178C
MGSAEAGTDGPGRRGGGRCLLSRCSEGPDGEENVRRGRHHRDLHPLVRRPVQERFGHLVGGGPQDGQEVPGAHVRFAKTSRVLAELAGGHADRTWEKRLHELIRFDVLILDDFAMRQLTATQADDLYELVSARQNKSLIITSNRSPSDWYPLFPDPVVAESLLDRVINTSHQVIMNGPSYRPNKRPKTATSKQPSINIK